MAKSLKSTHGKTQGSVGWPRSIGATRAVLVVLATGGGIAAAGYFAATRPLPAPAVATAAPPVGRAIPAEAPAPRPIALQDPAGPTPAPDRSAEVCGLARVAPTAVDADAAPRIPAHARGDAERALFDAMAASAQGAVRAAGQLLQWRAQRRAAAPGTEAVGQGLLDALAGSAAQTSDATVYAVALEACAEQGSGQPAACGALSAERWASLEPANAAPWLLLAHRARAAADDDALAAAVYQVSQADRIDWHEHDVVLAAARSIPGDASALARTLDVHAIAQARGAWAARTDDGLAAWCASDDPNRMQSCAGVARLLVQAGDGVRDLRLGTRIGQGLGWPAARVRALQARHDALANIGASAADDDARLGCADTARLGRRLARSPAAGTLEAALAATGRTRAQWADAVEAARRARETRHAALDR